MVNPFKFCESYCCDNLPDFKSKDNNALRACLNKFEQEIRKIIERKKVELSVTSNPPLITHKEENTTSKGISSVDLLDMYREYTENKSSSTIQRCYYDSISSINRNRDIY